MTYDFIETCYSTHHPQFGYDANDTLWTSGGGRVVGWLNTTLLDATGDVARSQGWTALGRDSNGKRDAYVEPNASADPVKDTRLNAPFYAVMPNPVDGSIWGSVLSVPGAVVPLAPGANPPETALAEIYNVPLPGFAARRADIDSKGVVWVSPGSGPLGSFNRRTCTGPLSGPKATGNLNDGLIAFANGRIDDPKAGWKGRGPTSRRLLPPASGSASCRATRAPCGPRGSRPWRRCARRSGRRCGATAPCAA